MCVEIVEIKYINFNNITFDKFEKPIYKYDVKIRDISSFLYCYLKNWYNDSFVLALTYNNKNELDNFVKELLSTNGGISINKNIKQIYTK